MNLIFSAGPWLLGTKAGREISTQVAVGGRGEKSVEDQRRKGLLGAGRSDKFFWKGWYVNQLAFASM